MAVANNVKMTVYFFMNGRPYTPPYKVCTSSKEIACDGFVQRVQRLFLYKGHIVYTMFGQLMLNKTQLHDNSAFVLVNREEAFMPAPYANVFRELLRIPTLAEAKPVKKKFRKNVPLVCACQNQPYSEMRNLRYSAGCHHMGVNIHCTDIIKPSKTRQPYELCPCASNAPKPANKQCVELCHDVPVQPCPRYKTSQTKKRGCCSCCGPKEPKRLPLYHVRCDKYTPKKAQSCSSIQCKKKEKTFKSEADLRASSARLAYKCQPQKVCKTKKKKKLKKPKPAYLEKKYLKYKKEKDKRLKKECERQLKEEKKRQKKKRSKSCCSCCSCCSKKKTPAWKTKAPTHVAQQLQQARWVGKRRRIESEQCREDPFLRAKTQQHICASQTCPDDFKAKSKKKKKQTGCFG